MSQSDRAEVREQLLKLKFPITGVVIEDGQKYYTFKNREVDAIMGIIDEAVLKTLEKWNPLYDGDHSACIDKMSCIGYQNARSDFDNEKEILIAALQKGGGKA